MNTRARLPGHRFLHSPGPSRVPDEVLHAMSRQPMDLADPRVDACIKACETGLKRLLHTEHDVFLYAANGHGAWEAVIANLVSPGTKVLVAGTGHFSESWAVQTEAMGGVVIRTPWVEGLPIAPADVEAVLRDDTAHAITAVFVVHTDTASGITSDLPAIRAAIDRAGHPALFVVDVVASLGAAPFDMTALRANVVLGACQKGLMVPPGLGFVAVDDVAMAFSRKNPAPRFYWDWRLRQSELSYRKFCGTPPQSLLAGLEAALMLIDREGEPAVLARHRRLADAVHAAVARWSEAAHSASSARCRTRARCRSRRSRSPRASTPRPCARSRASASRSRSLAAWARSRAGRSASATSATSMRRWCSAVSAASRRR